MQILFQWPLSSVTGAQEEINYVDMLAVIPRIVAVESFSLRG